MFRMNKLTDYGVVLLTTLAGDGVGRGAGPYQAAGLSARELAVRTNLPLPTVVKILKALGRSGVLVSQRGTKGGYALSRPPAQISIADVIEALEGPLALTECGVPDSCERETDCPTRPSWQVVNVVIRSALRRLTLAEMTHPRAASRAAAFSGPAESSVSLPARSVVP
jgi:FeS assembly SUF system regulator